MDRKDAGNWHSGLQVEAPDKLKEARMPDGKKYPDPRQFMEFDEDDPRYQVKILGMRVDALTKEKEELERNYRLMSERLGEMEKTFQRGAGIMLALPFVGGAVGVILAYGKVIFAPWTGGK